MARYENPDSRYGYDYTETDFDLEKKFAPTPKPARALNPGSRQTGKLPKKVLRSRRRKSNPPATLSSSRTFEYASLRRYLVREDSVALAAIAEEALSPHGRRARIRNMGLGASLLTTSQSEWLYMQRYANRPASKESQFNTIIRAHEQAANDQHPVLRPTLGEVVILGRDDKATNRKRFLAIQLQGVDADIAEFETVDLQAALGMRRSVLANYGSHISLGTLGPGEPAGPHIEALQEGLASLAETRGLTVALGEACLTMHQRKG